MVAPNLTKLRRIPSLQSSGFVHGIEKITLGGIIPFSIWKLSARKTIQLKSQGDEIEEHDDNFVFYSLVQGPGMRKIAMFSVHGVTSGKLAGPNRPPLLT